MNPGTSEAVPLPRAPTQVPWRRSACPTPTFPEDGRCLPPPRPNPKARGRPVRAPSAIGESGWASRGDRASQICTRATGRRVRHFGGRHRISYSRIRWSVGPPPAWAPRRGRRGPDIRSRLVRAVLVPIRARSYAVPTGLLDGWYPANPVVSIEDARAGGARWGRVAALRLWRALPRSGSAGNQRTRKHPFFIPRHQQRASARSFLSPVVPVVPSERPCATRDAEAPSR